MLSELVYVSERINLGDNEEVEDILQECIANNSGSITGALLYSRRKFIQYLEGDYNDVKKTFDRIGLDSRHRNIKLVIFSPIDKIVFPGWAMAEKQFQDGVINFKNSISLEEREIFLKLLNGETDQKHSLSKIIRKFFD